MAKIALELQRAVLQREIDGVPGGAQRRQLIQGGGWRVDDVMCTSGPGDRAFEERHEGISIAIVAAGSFQYRSTQYGRRAKSRNGGELMTPGSILLGNFAQCFECGHQHGVGDRCIAFHFTPEYFENIVAAIGGRVVDFRHLRLPPLPALTPLVVRACAALDGAAPSAWEELALQLAGQVLRLDNDIAGNSAAISPQLEARIGQIARTIEQQPDATLTVSELARLAGLSPYHFLRVFERLTGITPHQFILRARLREAALRLLAKPDKILDIAFDCGFGDVSNFNRAFRSEFGVSPRRYRQSKTAMFDTAIAHA